MKRFLLVSLLAAALIAPAVAPAQVETSLGTIQLGGKIKWLYAYMPEDEKAKGASDDTLWGWDGRPIEQFSTTNVELNVVGTVGENVQYIIELQASAFGINREHTAGGLTGVTSGPTEMGTIGVRQAKIVISDVIPMTQVTLGTFNLPVTIYQPRPTNEWDLISLPLINMAPVTLGNYPDAHGELYAPIGLGWQATGINLAFAPFDSLELGLAYFNGYAGQNPNTDVDLEKSYLATIKWMPSNFMLSASYMSEGWQEDTTDTGGTQQQNAHGWIVSASYLSEKFEANLDWVMFTAEDYQFDRKGKRTDLTWTGYQVTLGYWLIDNLQVVGRYEWIDPNTINDKDSGAGEVTKNDELTWITVGLNYRLNERSELAVNYIFREEQGSMIDVDEGKVGGKYQALNNDILLIQVQVWQ